MIKGIIFDCFGVLYVDVSHAYFARFPAHHEELYDLNKQADHGFIDRHAYIEAVAKITGVSQEATAQAFAEEHVVNQMMVDFIKNELKPLYKIGLLSNIGVGWIQDFFDRHQLHALFDSVVLSSEEGITKPNPLIYERMARKLGLSTEECLMIDDSRQNCEGAHDSGMKSLLYMPRRTSIDSIRKILTTEGNGVNEYA